MYYEAGWLVHHLSVFVRTYSRKQARCPRRTYPALSYFIGPLAGGKRFCNVGFYSLTSA